MKRAKLPDNKQSSGIEAPPDESQRLPQPSGAAAFGDPAVSVGTWIGFCAMCFGMFMAILDIQVVVTSLPNIQSALGISPDDMSWVQTSYLIAEVIAIPLTGLFTRIAGMRLLFGVFLSVFTLASIGCAASNGFAVIIFFRAIQGFAGGVLIPLVFTAVFRLFPFRNQDVATTIAGVLAVLAPTVGPLVGGWITATYSWHWLFLINVVPGIVSVVVASTFLPKDKPDWGGVSDLDWLSLGLMALALASLEIALKEAPKRGWQSSLVVSLSLIFALAGLIFVWRTLRKRHPIVALSAFADRDFAIGCWLSFVFGVGLFGSLYLMTVFLAFVREHDSLEIGEIMLATGIAQLITAPIAVQLERRSDARLLTACGFGVFAGGLLFSYFDTIDTDAAGMLPAQILRGTAIMFCLLPPTRLALGHFAPALVADASGLFNLMRNLGGAIGLALIDTILYGRAPGHADEIIAGLKAGDPAAAAWIGLPPGIDTKTMAQTIDADTEAMVRPLIEHAALSTSINESWAFLALVALAGLVVLPFASRRATPASLAANIRLNP
jgi:MFS transporter, DHA2 family, multidrug resistance protein